MCGVIFIVVMGSFLVAALRGRLEMLEEGEFHGRLIQNQTKEKLLPDLHDV